MQVHKLYSKTSILVDLGWSQESAFYQHPKVILMLVILRLYFKKLPCMPEFPKQVWYCQNILHPTPM